MLKPSLCSLFQFRLYKGVEPRWGEQRIRDNLHQRAQKSLLTGQPSGGPSSVCDCCDRPTTLHYMNSVCDIKWQVEMIIISCQWLSHVTATFFKLPVEPGTSRCVTFVLDRHITNLVSSKYSSLTHKNNFIFHRHAHSFQLPKIIYGAKVGIHNVSLYHPTGGETQKEW